MAAQNAVVTAALLQNAGFAAPHAAFIAALQQNAGFAAQNAGFTAVLLENAGFAEAAGRPQAADKGASAHKVAEPPSR